MKKQILVITLLLVSAISFSQSRESFELDWKKMKDWKQASHQEDSGNYLTEYLRKGDKLENWKELIAIQRLDITGARIMSLDALMNSGFEELKNNAPEAVLTVIQKDEEAANPWIEYKSESPRFNNDPNPESQFFHVVKTGNSIFLIWWAVKKSKITENDYKMYQEFFRSGVVK